MILSFDLLTAEVDRFTPRAMDNLCQFASKSVHSFSKYRVDKIGTPTEKGVSGSGSQVGDILATYVIAFLRHWANAYI